MEMLDISTKDQSYSVVIVLTLVARSWVFISATSTENRSLTYLQRYQYIPEEVDGQLVELTKLTEGIQAFQQLCGIEVTGWIDDATTACMARARCGNPDASLPPEHGGRADATRGERRRRFYIPIAGADWSPVTTHVTYDVVTYTEDLPPSVVDDSIARAFLVWSDATPLTFELIRGGDVDISIYFQPSYDDHGDGMPFDGPGMVLAHALWPWSEELTSDVHMDEAETWTAESYSGANLWLVMAHEIGHALGLGHSVVFGSLMFPFHFGYDPDFTLHDDDIRGIRHLYGDTALQPTIFPVSLDAPNLCYETMDSVMVDGYTYIFKGNYHWRVLNGKIEPGYPRRISNRWPGLEGDIDAVVTVKNGYVWGPKAGKTFFFKGRQVWRYTFTNLDFGFPKDVSEEFTNFPADVRKIKAVFEISGNGETYIFSDDGFYVYGWQGFQGPFGLSVFNSLPSNIVGVMQWTDNYIYFFTDNFLYYQCSPWTFTISRGYPRLAHTDWVGCGGQLNLEGANIELATSTEGTSRLLTPPPQEHDKHEDRSLSGEVSSNLLCVLFGLCISLYFKQLLECNL